MPEAHVNGIHLPHEEHGEGPPIGCIHGGGSSALLWPMLLVAASESPPEQREMTEAMARALPDARTALVGGGHLVDPAGPEVLAFVEEVLGRP